MPAEIESMPFLPGLSPVGDRAIEARFDGGLLSSDGGVLLLREVERRLGLSERFAACLTDRRDQSQVRHSLADVIRFRLLMIAAGYEDGNDANSLREDALFKLALERLPGDAALCSQSTVSRVENLPNRPALLRMSLALVDHYCASFRSVPKRITLDIDDTFDAVHGAQQLRLFNAHYDEYGFQPIVVFDGDGRFVGAALRPAKRPSGVEIRAYLRRLIAAIRQHWPRVEILLRADSHYCCPEVIDWCRANRCDFVLGLAPTTTLRRHVTTLEATTAARASTLTDGRKLRRFKGFYDGASTWSRVERIVARVEAGPLGTDTRFIVTNLAKGTGKTLYEDLYCQRGCAENHIKAWKTHLASDRTSCSKASANQFRLMLHAAAYWLIWSLRGLAPKKSAWRTAQFDTIRLRLIKLATRVSVLKTKIRLHFPTAMPDQVIFRALLTNLPKLVI